MKYVNKPVPKTDAMSLVTGKPVYTDDLAPSDCLIVKILISPHANAWVEDIKTGTAEKLPRGNGKYLVSFIGFAPVDDPALVIYVVVDEPKVDDQASSTYAQYIAQGILSEALPYLNVQPDEAEDGEVPTTELWELFKGISDSATGTGADGQKEAISDENVPSPPEDASEDSDTEDNNDMQSEGLTNEEAGLE